jgi:hypothetical protein
MSPTPGTVSTARVATCELHDDLAAMTTALAAARYGFCLVVTGDGIVLGRLRRSALQDASPDATAEQLMESAPSTIRPNIAAQALVDRLTKRDLKTAIVTTPEGALLGAFPREAAERQLG